MDQNNQEVLSKRKQKKLAKREKQKEHFKEKKIIKKQIKKQQKQQLKLTNLESRDIKEKKIKKDKEQYKEEMKNSVAVVIDLQFMNQMTISEKTSLYKQIELCHSMNFKSTKPLKLVVTSLTEDFIQLLNKSNAINWGIQLDNQSYIELYQKDQLVYLTGDTNEVMDNIKLEEIYIIGGLVDHNRLKQITYNKAIEQGIKTKKLPIQVDLKTSSILTVNQVFEILLRHHNGEGWDNAIEQAIPKRKKL